jgi:hypothetical protein
LNFLMVVLVLALSVSSAVEAMVVLVLALSVSSAVEAMVVLVLALSVSSAVEAVKSLLANKLIFCMRVFFDGGGTTPVLTSGVPSSDF